MPSTGTFISVMSHRDRTLERASLVHLMLDLARDILISGHGGVA